LWFINFIFKKYRTFNNFFADKCYDAKFIHEKCLEENIQTSIKPRKDIKIGFYRRKQIKDYSEERYHQRILTESRFSCLKKKHGSYILTKTAKSVKAELYL